MPIPLDIQDGIAVLRMELGRGNAINPAFVSAFHGALDEVERSDARAVVVTGKDRVFCAGLDLPTIGSFDRAALTSFVAGFEGLFRRVFAFSKPTVAAINGHAIAGGCILAMACDLRVMAEGPFQIGANEVQLGLAFPPACFEIIRQATPVHSRRAVLAQGRRFSPAEAHRAGIVQRLAAEGAALTEAMEEAQLFASAGAAAVRAVRGELASRVLAKIDAAGGERTAQLVDTWFSPEGQERIAATRARLTRAPE